MAVDTIARARYYQPGLGRFSAVDPLVPGEPSYSYANSNPYLFVDQYGMFPRRFFNRASGWRGPEGYHYYAFFKDANTFYLEKCFNLRNFKAKSCKEKQANFEKLLERSDSDQQLYSYAYHRNIPYGPHIIEQLTNDLESGMVRWHKFNLKDLARKYLRTRDAYPDVPGGKLGYYKKRRGMPTVYLNKGLRTRYQACAVLAHELGHAHSAVFRPHERARRKGESIPRAFWRDERDKAEPEKNRYLKIMVDKCKACCKD